MFRTEFEKQREAQTEAEVKKFREGIIRLMSNLQVYEIQRRYKEDPAYFDAVASGKRDINVPSEDEAEEEDAASIDDGTTHFF